jgi:hypothetical protein
MVQKFKGFPTFAVIILVLSIIWLLTELGLITINLPWIPIIFIIIAIGWIINHYKQ